MNERDEVFSDCPQDDACPPECRSVFDRVVVSYLIQGTTRIMWELLSTFTDPGPLSFQLQVGSSANPLADDWANVGLAVTDQYTAFDDEQRVWGQSNFTHYRVIVTSPLGTYYSLPTGGLGILDRRDWRHARELIRQRKLAYRIGHAGQRGYLLKRRWNGPDCTRCLDYQTKEVKDPDCPQCFGTGKQCGYFYPMACTWAEINPKSHRTELSGDQNRGTIGDVFTSAEMLGTELLDENDVFVVDKTDDRYYIHRIKNKVEIRGVPIIVDAELRLIPFSSPIYGIEIPEQLDSHGVCYAASPATRPAGPGAGRTSRPRRSAAGQQPAAASPVPDQADREPPAASRSSSPGDEDVRAEPG